MAKAKPLVNLVNVFGKPQASTIEAAATSARSGRAKNPDYTTLSVYVPRDLHTRVKLASIEDHREMSAVVEGLLQSWLDARRASTLAR